MLINIFIIIIVILIILDPPHLVLSWPIVQRWNRDKRKRRLGGESQVLQHFVLSFRFLVSLILDIIMLWYQICICLCICHLQSGTQVGGKSRGHGREERERVAGSQPGWGGWHAWHCACICICAWKSLYLCLKVFAFAFVLGFFLYLGTGCDSNYYLDWKVGGRRDGERDRDFGRLLTIGIWNQEQLFWLSILTPFQYSRLKRP